MSVNKSLEKNLIDSKTNLYIMLESPKKVASVHDLSRKSLMKNEDLAEELDSKKSKNLI